MKKEKSLGYFTEYFIKKLIKAFYDLSSEYEKIGIDLRGVLPIPFNKLETMYATVFYYKQTDRIEIDLREDKGHFQYVVVYEDHFRANLFKKEDTGKGSIVNRAEPVFNKKTGNYSMKIIGFNMYFSFESFVYRLNHIDELALDIIKSYVGEYLFHLEEDSENYILYLKQVANDFLKLIMDVNTPELVIDKFLENNSIVLKEGLGLEQLMHQVTLKNTINMFPNDLKPDLIARDVKERRWVIVDYKKSNRGLMKNINKTRTGLTAQVHSLKDQLRDYYEYFNEKNHRDYFEKQYNENIEYPTTIGIIGVLEDQLERDFNRIIEDEPRWFKVIPYNYLYNNFMNYINTVESITGGIFDGLGTD